MLELLSPAGSPEAVTAAVQNGADAVYMGFGGFNARQNAKNFTSEEFLSAVRYCHIRGVKVYATLNTLVSDRELHDAINIASEACEYGADAVLVQDLGILRGLRQALPELTIHASTQMSIHSASGAKVAAELGASRVVLARELSMENIARVCKSSPIETEVFCHGALCMCYSGQCYMSSVIGRRSGNRGLCAQPCRMAYSMGVKNSAYPLSLKDLSLAGHLQELDKLGVKCVKIEGRMRRPEYVAIVTRIYSQAIKSGRSPSQDELDMLTAAFSRQGFTEGFYAGKSGKSMLGVRDADDKSSDPGFSTIRQDYMHSEIQRIPIKFYALVQAGQPAKLAVEDDRGNLLTKDGTFPSPAQSRELSSVTLQTQLFKTGGTPYICTGVKSQIDSGLFLSVSAINELRRDLLLELSARRRLLPPRRAQKYISESKLKNTTLPPDLTISVLSASQLLPEMAELAPSILYVPLEEILQNPAKIAPFLSSTRTEVIASLPQIIHDSEEGTVLSQLVQAKKMGILNVLVGNLGHIELARMAGLGIRGDYGLNVWNSGTLHTMRELGLSSATLSFELRLSQIKDISKFIDAELIVYGRLPLMIAESCIIKNSAGHCDCSTPHYLKDRRGALFPVFAAWGCRNAIYNSKKLYLADKAADYQKIGLRTYRLMFTTENAHECLHVMESYLGLGIFEPGDVTRGLYYRGTE